jgi:hypothetical protein
VSIGGSTSNTFAPDFAGLMTLSDPVELLPKAPPPVTPKQQKPRLPRQAKNRYIHR